MSESDSSKFLKIVSEISDISCEEILQLVRNSSSKELQLNWIIKQLEQKICLERELNEISLKYNNLVVDYDQFKFELKNKNRINNLVKKTPKKKSTNKTSKNSNILLAKNFKRIIADIHKIYELVSKNIFLKNPTSNVSVQTEFEIGENLNVLNLLDICEHDFEKKFIRLTNTANFEIKIGNFQLISYLNGFEIANFKFHKSTYLKANSSLTLWSNYSPFKKHHPPNEIEMEDDQMNDENINKLVSILTLTGDVWDVLLDTNNNVISLFNL